MTDDDAASVTSPSAATDAKVDPGARENGEPLTLNLPSGSSIGGTSFPLTSADVPEALSKVVDAVDLLPPERPGEGPADPAMVYSSESAGGFGFPREHLTKTFDEDLAARHKDGVPVLRLVDADNRGGATGKPIIDSEERVRFPRMLSYLRTRVARGKG